MCIIMEMDDADADAVQDRSFGPSTCCFCGLVNFPQTVSHTTILN